MADLKRVPGCHVYWGPAPLGPGAEKLPKEKIVVFNIDGESDLKDAPSFKTPFDKERPVPLDSFDAIVKGLINEDDKTQCVFNSKEEIPATVGKWKTHKHYQTANLFCLSTSNLFGWDFENCFCIRILQH